MTETLKSKLKSLFSEDAQGKFQPIRRLYACSFASGARDTAQSITSSLGSDFNFDFNVSVTEAQQREGTVEYNYRPSSPAANVKPDAGREGPAKGAAMTGTDVSTYARERPGMSAFMLEDGIVYHTYSTYARGLDGLWGMYQWLDRAPKGRNEAGGYWLRHRDKYGDNIGA